MFFVSPAGKKFFSHSSALTVEMAIFGSQNWLPLGSSSTQRIVYTWERFYLKVLKWENPPLICIIWDDRTHLKLLAVCAHLTSEPSLQPMSVHSLNTITHEQMLWDFLCLRPVWPTKWVLQLYRKFLSWSHQKKKNPESNKDHNPTLISILHSGSSSHI